MSPSSRRAWIEIKLWLAEYVGDPVALLAEGVDRNIGGLVNWPSEEVALLAEGVDRNLAGEYGDNTARRRPPRGGRG